MTSITHRTAALFRIKANKALDKAEDPREVVDRSYEQQTITPSGLVLPDEGTSLTHMQAPLSHKVPIPG